MQTSTHTFTNKATTVNAQSAQSLSPQQLEYFKKHGNNALIFIHGFNVHLGHYPRQISDIKFVDIAQLIGRHTVTKTETRIEYSDSLQTIYRDPELLARRFPEITHNLDVLPNELKDDLGINGNEAHSWFIHMEDNMNRASGQFDRTDYTRYVRLINIAWSGDRSDALNYLAAEEEANIAGRKLLALVMQLYQAGITINIIAHSLGCRVLLTLMNELGQQGHNDYLNHVFLWQAAVSDTALSNDPQRDTTIKQNSKFIYAHAAARKITVLYSEEDDVLGLAYWFANYVGVAPEELDTEEGYTKARQYLAYSGNYPKITLIKRFAEIIRDPLFKSLVDATLLSNTLHVFHKELRERTIALEEDLVKKHNIRAAMGFKGPDTNDPFIKKIIDSGKLNLVTQNKCLFTHSGMKIPSTELMYKIYHKCIYKSADFKFGSY
ncbi:hypothetical protein BH10PSE19_BH10PSE19_11280 [soil metagenome]